MNERKTWVNKRPANMSLRSACAVLGVESESAVLSADMFC